MHAGGGIGHAWGGGIGHALRTPREGYKGWWQGCFTTLLVLVRVLVSVYVPILVLVPVHVHVLSDAAVQSSLRVEIGFGYDMSDEPVWSSAQGAARQGRSQMA